MGTSALYKKVFPACMYVLFGTTVDYLLQIICVFIYFWNFNQMLSFRLIQTFLWHLYKRKKDLRSESYLHTYKLYERYLYYMKVEEINLCFVTLIEGTL